MRNLLFVLMVLSGWLVCSCSSESVLEEIPLTPEVEEEVLTRSIVDGGSIVSTSNPDLYTNWENLSEIVLNQPIFTKVTAPWKNGASTSMPTTFTMDIKKADGWSMLFHTFEAVGKNPGLHYMCFYNKLTGKMKVMYYKYENPPYNNGFMWTLKTMNGERSSFFSLNNFIVNDMKSAEKYSEVFISNMAANPAQGFTQGWNGFEYEIPYSDNLGNTKFLISGVNKIIQRFDFEGKLDIQTQGKILQSNTQTSKPEVPKDVVKLAGEGSKKYVDKLASSPKVGSKIKDLIKKIPASGYGAAIKGGLGFILGPILGSGDSAKPLEFDVDLTTTGSLTLSGTSSLETPAAITTLGNIDFTKYVTEGFGLWNLESQPKVLIDRYSIVTEGQYSEELQNPVYGNIYYVRNLHVFTPTMNVNCSVKINPEIERFVTQKRVYTNILFYDKLNGVSFADGQITNKILPRLHSSLYSDDKMHLKEVSLYGTQYGNAEYKWGYVNWYDWGPAANLKEKILVNITVELTLTYNGKTKQIISSRNYLPQILNSNQDPKSPMNYIITNMGFYPLFDPDNY